MSAHAAVVDGRTAPFCWVSIPALSCLRAGWPEPERPKLSSGIAVLVALAEIANENRARTSIAGDSSGFEAARGYIAQKAGVDRRTVDAVGGVLEGLGLLEIKRRRIGKGFGPSTYVLREPGSETSSPPGDLNSPGVAKPIREGGETDSQGVANSVRTTTQEERKEEKKEQQRALAKEWAAWLAHFHQTTGRTSVLGTDTARKAFTARRREGRSLDDLKFATVGCHGDDYLRGKKFDVPDTILRPGNIERYIQLGRDATATTADRSQYSAGIREVEA